MQNMPHCVKIWRHSQNRKYITYCVVVRGWPSHGHRQQTENFVKFGYVVFKICKQTDRHADRHTDTLITLGYFAPLPRERSCTWMQNDAYLKRFEYIRQAVTILRRYWWSPRYLFTISSSSLRVSEHLSTDQNISPGTKACDQNIFFIANMISMIIGNKPGIDQDKHSLTFRVRRCCHSNETPAQ